MSVNPPPPAYKGAPLDPARGPGLGCFWIQVAILVVFVIATPIGVANGWPAIVTLVMFATVIVLLFFVGQTSIFLMRLVSADRRARRRPIAPRTPTVGDLDDASGSADDGRSRREREDGGEAGTRRSGPTGETPSGSESGESSVRE
jgi:hypothetical protein